MKTAEKKNLETRLDAAYVLMEEVCGHLGNSMELGSTLHRRVVEWLNDESPQRRQGIGLGDEAPSVKEADTCHDAKRNRTFRLRPECALSVNDIADRLGACLGWLNCTLRPPITVSRADIIEALEAIIDGLE